MPSAQGSDEDPRGAQDGAPRAPRRTKIPGWPASYSASRWLDLPPQELQAVGLQGEALHKRYTAMPRAEVHETVREKAVAGRVVGRGELVHHHVEVGLHGLEHAAPANHLA